MCWHQMFPYDRRINKPRTRADVVALPAQFRCDGGNVQHAKDWPSMCMDVPESAALRASIDVMQQPSLVALVNDQQVQLRAAIETELKFP